MMKWSLTPYTANFRRPLKTARGVWRERRGFLISVRDAEGRVGRGEAVPLPAWGSETEEACRAALEAWCQGKNPGLERDAWRTFPAAYAAVEQALWDLEAQVAGLPLSARFGPRLRDAIPVNALITDLDNIPAGFAAYKLKLTGHLAFDLQRVAAVRAAIGDAALRLDANGGWNAYEALHALEALAEYAPEYVEEPVSLEHFPEVVKHAAVPVAADESVRVEHLERLVAAGVRIWVAKPAALGGLGVTRELVERYPDVQVVLTSALDRGLATAGVLQLAATLPRLPVCGLATAGLFDEEPLLDGLAPVGGTIAVPTGAGLWQREGVPC